MHSLLVAFLLLASSASAHFALTYPEPWGELNEDKQTSFCDGYTRAENRTQFPLHGGVINLLVTHTKWTAGVILATVPNPTSFDNFTSSGKQQLVVPFFEQTEGGQYCFPIEIGSSGISGVQDKANVTIQIVLDGGDGKLYQCADLTLSNSVTVPPGEIANCKNVTKPPVASGSSASPSNPTGGSSAHVFTSLLVLALVFKCTAFIIL